MNLNEMILCSVCTTIPILLFNRGGYLLKLMKLLADRMDKEKNVENLLKLKIAVTKLLEIHDIEGRLQ